MCKREMEEREKERKRERERERVREKGCQGIRNVDFVCFICNVECMTQQCQCV